MSKKTPSKSPQPRKAKQPQEHLVSDEALRRDIATIQARYQISSRADAIRFAVRVLAESPMLTIQPPTPKKRGPKPRLPKPT